MEPRAAWGAGIVLAAVLVAGAWPGSGRGPPAAGCDDAALIELRGDATDDGAFGPPRLVCRERLVPALASLGCPGARVPAGEALAIAGSPSHLDGPAEAEREGRARSAPGPRRAFEPRRDARRATGSECNDLRPVSLSARTALLLGRPVDVNRADAQDLEALPGIGPGLARRIVAARERDGPFAGLPDLRRVKGLGASRIRALEGWAVTGDAAAR
jgi:competence protein ComEA